MMYPKRLFARISFAALLLLAIMVPVVVLAAGDVKIDSTVGVANVTAGDKAYSQAVNAKYNEVIKLQVSYRNVENATSNKVAEQVRLKIDVPTAAGKAQAVKSSINGYNTNAIDKQVMVNLERDDATLQYIPGSAVWKHNTASSGDPKFTEQKISDEIVSGAQGMVLEDQKPGSDHDASVTVLVRVMTPGVKVTKQVELSGESNKWADSNTAKPGDTLKYLIGYQNTGNVAQNKVIVRDSLPAHVSIVPGTTSIVNTTNPNGVTIPSDNIANGGIDIGNYAAGANAYITFQAKVDAVDKLACGDNVLRGTTGVQPQNTSEYFASAVTTANRDCAANPTPPASNPNPTPPAQSPTPTPTPPPATTPTSPSPPASSTPTPTPTPSAGSGLPSTGPGDVIGLFIGATVIGTFVHRFVIRRFAR
jgi:uncharacterized repeat protein (TIGR01451 family)